MVTSLGLDIGSNSVGSAWVDTGARRTHVGVTVFPAGVDETEIKRGAPVAQHRRQKRGLRRSIARRAARKRKLQGLLIRVGLLPRDRQAFSALWDIDPWTLRSRGLAQPLTPFEFGRVLVHLSQRRGALGVKTDEDESDEGAVKDAIDRTRAEIDKRGLVTFGELMVALAADRRECVRGTTSAFFQRMPVRNRAEFEFQFHADRQLIRKEFELLWERQKSFGGSLSELLTDELKQELDDEREDPSWRHKGILFGQRRTYWNAGTLGRCDLEPTEHRCPIADMFAQEFRVIETVNNIRIEERGKPARSLTDEERRNLIGKLRTEKAKTLTAVRKALGLNRGHLKGLVTLNIERDPDREINTDWFYREISCGVFMAGRWSTMSERERDSVNHAILKFDSDNPAHEEKLRCGASRWWQLDADAVGRLIAAWKSRERIERRMNLSRRAIRNLLPYMNIFDATNNRWPTQNEARARFAADRTNGATSEQRDRYRPEGRGLTKRDRQFLKKHPDLLPPAPTLANPVVRKAIHEVRRHVIAYLRRFGRKPDRVVIELAREAKQPATVRNQILASNRKREAERKRIVEDFNLAQLAVNQQRQAVERVQLCREQRNLCLYTGRTISDAQAASGTGVEVDHIVPWSRSLDNGLNNKVLCCVEANREKTNQTPMEWLSPDDFAKLEQRIFHWKTEHPRKWENLHRDPQPLEDFINSQLTDTAYAARQVGQYLRETLFDGERDDKKRVFFTKGTYTAILRRDWQLIADDGPKPRTDHRHHALDAVVIALTTDRILQDLARSAEAQERARAGLGRWPKREPLPPPWGTVEEFRQQVLGAVSGLVTAHRPVKRKIVGAFHEDTAYGPVIGPLPSHRCESPGTLFTNRIGVDRLTPKHLRVPVGWDKVSAKLDDVTLVPAERRSVRRELSAMKDPPPAKSGIVRDRALRDRLRKCLRAAGLDPDNFTKNEIAALVKTSGLTLPSGVPLRRVVLLRTINDPVRMPCKKWDPVTGLRANDPDPRTKRVYIGGNNHHIEIRENTKTGKWLGEVVDTFTAAKRVRIEKRTAVDRSDRNGERFVMSLAEGEAIYMRHPETNEPGYFVVSQLDKPRKVHLIHHWDARRKKPNDGRPGREEILKSPEQLRGLGPTAGSVPQKVAISPLGEVRPLRRD